MKSNCLKEWTDQCCASCFVSSRSTLLVDAITQDGIDNDKDPLDFKDPLLYTKDTSMKPLTQPTLSDVY